MNLSEYLPIWSKLTPAQQALFQDHIQRRTVRKGTIVHNGSLDCAGVLLVCTGQLRAYILSDEGREITVYRLFPHDQCLLSASCIMRSIQFEILIAAEKDSDLLIIPPKIYQSLMEKSAPVANFTSEIMGSRFSDVMFLLEQILWKSFDKRLAAFLLEEAQLEETACLKTTHEAIGSHLGSPREVVTRMLRYFQSEGMVRLSRGSVELTDLEKLRALAQD